MQIRLKTFYYYRLFFNFNYYLYLVPYRAQLVHKSHPYVLVSAGSFRRWTCIIFHIILCLTSITVVWGSFMPSLNSGNGNEPEEMKPIRENPLRLFALARALGFPAYTFTLVWCIWWRKDDFIQLLQLEPRPEKICTFDIIKISSVTTLTCLMAIIFAPFYMLEEDFFHEYDSYPKNGTSIPNSTKSNWGSWDFHKGFYNYAGTVSQNLLLQPTARPLTEAELTPWIVTLTVLYGLLNIYLILLIHFADTFVMIGALAIHDIAKELNDILTTDLKKAKNSRQKGQNQKDSNSRRCSSLRADKLLECYGEVKELIDHINAGTGPMVVAMFFVTLPYFVENLASLFDPYDWSLKIRFLYYFIHYFISIIIAAEANRLLSEVKNWVITRICEDSVDGDGDGNQVKEDEIVMAINEGIDGGTYFKLKCTALPTIAEQIGYVGGIEFNSGSQMTKRNSSYSQNHNKMNTNDHWKLTLLYLESCTQSLGLRGCGFFTITYGFMGSIIGILLTYFIVMVQFRAQIPTGMSQFTLLNSNTNPVQVHF